MRGLDPAGRGVVETAVQPSAWRRSAIDGTLQVRRARERGCRPGAAGAGRSSRPGARHPARRLRRTARRSGRAARPPGRAGTAPVGMYGGLEMTTSTRPSSSLRASAARRERASHCLRRSARGFESSTRTRPRRLRHRRPSRAAPRSRARMRSRRCRCPGRPRAVRPWDRLQRVDRELRDLLGLGAGHEHPRPNGELQHAEVGAAGDVLQRFARDPALEHLGRARRTGRSRSSAPASALAWTSPRLMLARDR